MKKFLLYVTVVTALFSNAYIVYAGTNSITPLEVLPKDMQMVINVDMKQSTAIGNLLKRFAATSGETAVETLVEVAVKNKLIAGFRGKNAYGAMVEDVFIAVQMTNEQFETVGKAFGGASELTKKGEVIAYSCTEENASCFARLGKYFYITNSAKNMDEIIMNFKNGERDVLRENKEYMHSQSINVFKSTLDFYLDFEFVVDTAYTEVYGGDTKMAKLVTDIIKSLDYESGSLAIGDTKTSGRIYIKHNDFVRNLPFSYSDFMFKPNLYSYIDATDLMFYEESSNIKKRMDFVTDLISDEIIEEAEAMLRLLSLLDSRTAFALRRSTEDSVPRFTFLAELRRNNQRSMIETVDKLAEQIMYDMPNNSPVKIKNIKQGLYEITYVLNEDDAGQFGTEEIVVTFGVNGNGQFIVSNDKTAGTKHKNAGTTFEKNVKGTPDVIGAVFVDFKEISDYLKSIDNLYTTYGYESFIDTLDQLDLLTLKAYAGVDFVKVDFDFTYSLDNVVEKLLESIEEEIY